ncbi:Hsp70 family protein [Rhodococcus hoagii]|nr:Hsp70 family protein [Prescottella equi]NKS56499.1 Hsp70 family protein [Prescottella equi]NKS64847.1 Hsp70 family protein [Prescottella equi]NKS70087.1 Hsp70 family protein [Prescottella equi]NKS72009.1 Hsp70 family protein [Prescottella equi]
MTENGREWAMTPQSWVLAVDFGTSNTAAAQTDAIGGTISTLPLSHHGNLLPSAVFVESPDAIVVGEVALNRAETNPAGFLPSPKRVIGHGMLHLNGYDLDPALPIAAILSAVLARAVAAHAGQPPARLVLTHPEGWSPQEIQVLLSAAGRLGFTGDRVTTVSEPRAAAHFYARSDTIAAGDMIAVFDFGGGTLDIAVLSATATGEFTVIAARGDNGLGGKNLDAIIRRWVDQELRESNPELLDYLRREAPVHVLRGLEDSIRRAKELLSEAPSATITVAAPGQQETLSLTRDEFDDLIAAEIDRAVSLTQATLADVGITGGDLKALYLTGGSSRIPLVHQRLAALGPIDDPKTVVARGALIATRAQTAGLTAQLTPLSSTPRAQLPTTDRSNPNFPTDLHAEQPAKPRKLLLIAVAVAIAVGGVITAVRTLGSGDNRNASDSATAPSSNSTSSSDTSGQYDTIEAITAALPPDLSRASTCKKGTFSAASDLAITCKIDPNSPLAKGAANGNITYIAWVNKAEAKKIVLEWREHIDPAFLTENTTRTAVTYIDDSNSFVRGQYANMDTGLYISIGGFTDTDAAAAFFQRTSLL